VPNFNHAQHFCRANIPVKITADSQHIIYRCADSAKCCSISKKSDSHEPLRQLSESFLEAAGEKPCLTSFFDKYHANGADLSETNTVNQLLHSK